MAQLKTQPNDNSVDAFIASIPDQSKRVDATALTSLMSTVTGLPPTMWGDAMVGFGSYVYTWDGFEQHQTLLAKRGKHSVAKSCLYIGRLSDVDVTVLEELVRRSFLAMRKTP